MSKGWLTLERKDGELIRVGDVLIVYRRSGTRAKISIHAPQVMRILRGELPDANADGLISRVIEGPIPGLRQRRAR